jgi:hypothetical protein
VTWHASRSGTGIEASIALLPEHLHPLAPGAPPFPVLPAHTRCPAPGAHHSPGLRPSPHAQAIRGVACTGAGRMRRGCGADAGRMRDGCGTDAGRMRNRTLYPALSVAPDWPPNRQRSRHPLCHPVLPTPPQAHPALPPGLTGRRTIHVARSSLTWHQRRPGRRPSQRSQNRTGSVLLAPQSLPKINLWERGKDHGLWTKYLSVLPAKRWVR